MDVTEYTDEDRSVWGKWARTVFDAARQAVERGLLEEPSIIARIDRPEDARFEVTIDLTTRRLAVYLRIDDTTAMTVGHIVLDARDPERLGAWERVRVAKPIDFGEPQ